MVKKVKDVEMEKKAVPAKVEKKRDIKSEEKKQEANKSYRGAMPKKPTSAYLFFNNETVKRLKEEKEISQGDAFKESGALWKTISDKEKERYVKLENQDKERYNKQMAEIDSKGYFLLGDGSKSTSVRNWSKEDQATILLPKKPASPYNIFFSLKSKEIKSKMAEGTKQSDVMKEASKQWSEMSEEAKKQYEAIFNEKVKKYES